MNAFDEDRWRLLSPHLDRALEMSGETRKAWLASLRADDPSLAADLEALLDERSALSREGFLDRGPAPPSLAGQVVGAYTLLSLVGQGGMGSVWLARRSDGRFEGMAAVKLLNPGLAGRQGEERFRREGGILARLQHPHIAHLIDAGVSPLGQPYLVLEFVDGQRIDAHCDARRLPVEGRIRLFLDVLAAVAHAHASLIVHRDVKPSNVLVGTDGQVKLLDFGIAKLLEPDTAGGDATALTREGGAVLTPEYAAPEQVTGGPITTATDVYALGVLLYVLLGGRHPTGTAQSPAELLKAIVETAPPRLSDAYAPTGALPLQTRTESAARRATTPERVRRLLQGDLDTIVAKALKKDPGERYASVTAFADDLRRALEHQPIRARPDTVAYRTAKFVHRHAAGVVGAGTVALLLAGLVGYYTARLTSERDRARLEAEKAAKVSELLTGLLTGSDPHKTPEKNEPTLRGILDAGAQRIQGDLSAQPELQAEMLTTIGRVYQRLGLHDKAQPLLEQALAVGRRVSGPEHERVAQSLNDLGVLLREKGDPAAAVPRLEEALAMRRRLLGEGHKDVAVTLVELGRAYNGQGHRERAEPLFRGALKIRQTVLGEEHRETATSLGDLGLLLRERGDLVGAEPLLRQSLAISQKVLGENHTDVATALSNVGLVVEDGGEHAAAESLFRQALLIRRQAMGERHRSVAITLNNLAQPLRSQRKLEEAAAVLEEALEIARLTLPAEHPQFATFKVSLARVLLDQGNAGAAEPLLRHALHLRRALPQDDWRVGVSKSLLGGCLTALGRFEEAEPLLLDAKGVLKPIPGAQGREAEATRVRLVALYEAWGRPEPSGRSQNALKSLNLKAQAR